jgi:integrase
LASIRKKGKNSYQFRVSLGLGADNTYKYKYKTYKPPRNLTGKKLKDHLDYKAYKFEQEVLSGNYITPEKLTFLEFTEKWRTKWLEQEVSENTIMLRLNSLKNHIVPVIGHLTMDKITTLILLDLMDNLTRKDGKDGDLSVSSKQEVYKVLVSVFKRAVDWNVLKENPMNGVHPPREKRRTNQELNIYSKEDIKPLMKQLKSDSVPYHWYIFIRLSISTGMRRGELLALEWKNIDLETGIINIIQMVSRTSKGGHEIKSPKFNSIRSVHLSEPLVNDLKKYKLHCKKEKIKLQHKWKETKHDWVFFNEEGTHFHADTPTKWWRKFLIRNGLKLVRLHDLRHTSATLLIEENVHPKVISERLGHKRITTTMDIYGHSTSTADKEASNKLNSLFI